MALWVIHWNIEYEKVPNQWAMCEKINSDSLHTVQFVMLVYLTSMKYNKYYLSTVCFKSRYCHTHTSL